VKRPVGYVALTLAAVAAGTAWTLDAVDARSGPLAALESAAGAEGLLIRVLIVVAVVFGAFGAYWLSLTVLQRRTRNKRRAHSARNVLRLAFVLLALVGVLGALTEQWVGVLVSLGVVGFAITFALQQPLLSLLGWFYILLKQPYAVGDRVAIGGSRGDVIDVDYLVTTLWEIDGDLVSTNQPSGRTVTVPNSVVLSSQVINFSWDRFPHVWNETTIQVAYETDVDFAREVMIEEADALIGDEMANHIERYRAALSETPVELELRERPTVNVVQAESWLELRVRYLVHPKRGTRVRNELYERVLDRFNEHPDRVKFPIGRNR
jgi:small-conductance mechanosensitive channel